MRRAVFLDRDGTVNREVNILRNVKQLRLLPGVARAIAKLNDLECLVIIITNQPVIARGWVTQREVEEIHKVLIERLNKFGAKIDAIYYCPHHPNANLKAYRLQCTCRKPEIGLFKKAAKDFKINLKKSFSIGDSTSDILAGKRAGTTTILVKTGLEGKDGKYKITPDYTVKNLREAVKLIQKLI